MKESLRIKIYSFFSMNKAFQLFTKLSTQERKNLLQLKNIEGQSKKQQILNIKFKKGQKTNLMIDFQYIQNFSNHYLFFQDQEYDLRMTQYFNYFIETFPQKRIAEVQISFIFNTYNYLHNFYSIQKLENQHKSRVKKCTMKISGYHCSNNFNIQEYLLDTQEISIYNSVIGHCLFSKFKNYESEKQSNSAILQAMRNEIFTSSQKYNLETTKFVFQNSAIIDPQFIGNMISAKNVQIINSCFHQYSIDQLLLHQSIERIKIIYQSTPDYTISTMIRQDLQILNYELNEEDIVKFKLLNSLTIQFNDIERFRKLKNLLIENYSTNFKIKIIIGFQTCLKQIVETCFFPMNFEVCIISPQFSILEPNFYNHQDFESFRNKGFMQFLSEEIQKLKCYQFQQLSENEIRKSLKKSQLAIQIFKHLDVEKQERISIKLYVCNYLNLKAIMGLF